MGVDRRGYRRRAIAQDFRDGYERYTIGEHQCCCGMPEVVEGDVGQLQRLERALEVLYQVGAMNWCPRLGHEDQVQGVFHWLLCSIQLSVTDAVCRRLQASPTLLLRPHQPFRPR